MLETLLQLFNLFVLFTGPDFPEDKPDSRCHADNRDYGYQQRGDGDEIT